ncbi:MAG: indole-3-glycerol-phosphate synthase TrpC, partial [Pseudomonadota bacterium]
LALGLDVLLEIHDGGELPRAQAWAEQHPTQIRLGINNRNLHTFETTLETTERLAPRVPADREVVGESGLFTPADLARLARIGVRRFLIGESLMRAEDVAAATRTILADPLPATRGAA